MYTTYEQMISKIWHLQEFEGNSVTAYFDTGGNYKVFSYGTLILTIDPAMKIQPEYFDNRSHSRTTSRLQNIIATMFELPRKRNKKVYTPIWYRKEREM